MSTKFLFAWLVLTTFGASPAFSATTITGTVKDASGHVMNGVFVSASSDAVIYTVTVYSDNAGNFRFPEMAGGTYTVTAHTGGYQSSQRLNVVVKDGQTVPLDFALEVETRPAELVKQATAAEWLASLPGTMKQKYSLSRNCDGCHHNVYQLRDYRFTKEDWVKIISVMERIDAIAETRPNPPMRWVDGTKQEIAEYLAQIQGPDSALPKIQFSPRPTGKATQAIITEYRIPRQNAIPHDVYLDSQGFAWYNDFKTDYLGKLNIKTGEIKEYKLPTKPGPHPGSEEMFIGGDQNVWIGQRLEKRYLRFDPRMQEVTGIYDDTKFLRVDVERGVAIGIEMQMDLKTGNVTRYTYKGSIDGYGNGFGIDSNGIGYKGGFTSESVIRALNPKTGEVTNYPTPTPDAAPRRLSMGMDDNPWFGEWRGGKIGKLDVKSGKITEYGVSDPFAAIYQADMDPKTRAVWAYDWLSDRQVRLDPKTGETTEYPMPTLDIESRRTAFDPTATTTTMWLHGAGTGTIIRLQAP